MIVLWGSLQDEPIAAVRDALARARTPFMLLEPDQVGQTEVELTVDGGGPRGTLRCAGERVELASLRALYLRPEDPARIPAVARAGQASSAYRHALAVHEALRVFTELCGATVVNRLSAMASNASKPYQARLIAEHGFATPETMLTTDADAARTFRAAHGEVIYKSISGVRSIVGVLDDRALERFARAQACPTQLQRRVSGVDHRVHVIGEQVFVARIESEAVDYRYASRSGHARTMSVTSLPKAEQARCRSLARALGLTVAGIDLRLTPAGGYVCFEVNPSPAFTFYPEREAMADALAALLASAGVEKPRARPSAAPKSRSSSPPASARARHEGRASTPAPKPTKKRRPS